MKKATQQGLDHPVAHMDLENTEFIVVLEGLEERDNVDAPPRYRPDGTQVDPAQIIWKFQLFDMDRNALTFNENLPIYVWQSTSTSGFYDPNGRMTSRARLNVHALLGHSVTDAEFDMMLTNKEDDEEHYLPYILLGESAVATLNTYQRRDGAVGVGIQSIRKYIAPKATQKAKKATATSDSTSGTSDEDDAF